MGLFRIYYKAAYEEVKTVLFEGYAWDAVKFAEKTFDKNFIKIEEVKSESDDSEEKTEGSYYPRDYSDIYDSDYYSYV